MKKTLSAVMLMACVTLSAQIEGLKPFTASDTIVVSGKSYAVDIVNNDNMFIQYYIAGDTARKIRKIDKNKVDRIVDYSKRDLTASVIDPEFVKGKTLFVQVTPFSPSLSRYWQVVVDDGVNGNYLLTDEKGEKIKFFSEMAIVNYFIGLGWEMHKIQLVEKGTVGGASLFLDAAVGGSTTISSNVYFFKALYKGG